MRSAGASEGGRAGEIAIDCVCVCDIFAKGSARVSPSVKCVWDQWQRLCFPEFVSVKS